MAGAPVCPPGSQETAAKCHSARLAGVTAQARTRHLGDHGQGQQRRFFKRQIGRGTAGGQGTGAGNMLGSWNLFLKLRLKKKNHHRVVNRKAVAERKLPSVALECTTFHVGKVKGSRPSDLGSLGLSGPGGLAIALGPPKFQYMIQTPSPKYNPKCPR